MKLNLNIKHYHLKAKVVMFKTLLLLTLNVFSQTNLVPNYSFEDYVICPTSTNHPPPPPWYSAGKARNTGYVNACNPDLGYTVPTNGGGFQYARTGDAYLGLYFVNGLNQNKRNYTQVKLKDSLKQNCFYYAEFYSNLSNTQKYACNNIGMLFTDTAVYVDTFTHPLGVLPANPQITNYGNPIITDTLNWVKVSGIYKAQGGEQFITIGNFKTDAQTNYQTVLPTGYNGAGYLIDDVSVIPLDSFCLKADAGKDTSINAGDSVFIGSYTNGLDSVKWFVNGTTLIDSIRPGFWVKPTVTTSYMLQQTINGCFSADTVVVNVGAVPLKFIQFTASPTPPKEGLIKVVLNWVTSNEINVSHFNIQRSTNGKDFISIGTLKAQNKSNNEYNFTDDKLPTTNDQLTLYYRIESIDNDGKKQYSETRSVSPPVGGARGGVFVFPNPAKDFINITCKDGIKEVRMLDMMGREMSRKVFRQAQNDIRQNQNGIQQTQNNNGVLNPLLWRVGEAKGLYLLKIITTKNNEYNEKLIVQ